MYVQRISKRVKDKVYTTILLMKSIRQGKKVDHKTIANITKWPPHIISALEFSLKGGKIEEIKEIGEYQRKQGKSYGALKVVVEVARWLGIEESLGRNRPAILALIMIAGQIISQRSRWYIANFWSKGQAIDEVFKKEIRFDEDDLYETLVWLSENQERIEQRIWKKMLKESPQGTKAIFLYDVTSTYVEGEKMALSEYGYPRGAVKGKKQIVIGLLTDKDGYPLTVEVFKGNTNDYKTVVNQLEKIKKNYGAERVVFVGDRGMIKSEQIKEITEEPLKWNYITAITKPQIEKMISDGIIQLGLFDEKLCEIEDNEIRYIMRRNPMRAEEIKKNLEARIVCIE
ncbi:MAG: IS1634 family transposase, partial [Candidatus Diapherotrites archaeon]